LPNQSTITINKSRGRLERLFNYLKTNLTQKQQLNADDDENLDEVDEDNDNQNRRNI
jgi:hypothetical protein